MSVPSLGTRCELQQAWWYQTHDKNAVVAHQFGNPLQKPTGSKRYVQQDTHLLQRYQRVIKAAKPCNLRILGPHISRCKQMTTLLQRILLLTIVVVTELPASARFDRPIWLACYLLDFVSFSCFCYCYKLQTASEPVTQKPSDFSSYLHTSYLRNVYNYLSKAMVDVLYLLVVHFVPSRLQPTVTQILSLSAVGGPKFASSAPKSRKHVYIVACRASLRVIW